MLAALLSAALVFSPADARFAHQTAGELVSAHTPRDAGTARGRRAADFIFNEANATGLDARIVRFTDETPKGRRCFMNVVAEYRSNPTGEWSVVVSHYDTKPGTDCPGANDGASTSGLLVALAGALAREKPDGNVMLVWTDGEECMDYYSDRDGFHGSKHAAASLKADGRPVKAVICADMLGDADLQIVIPHNATPELRTLVLGSAAKAGLSDRVTSVPDLVKDDHVAFLRSGFPALDLIDFTYGSTPGKNDYWHTSADTMDHVSKDSLLVAGRLISAILNDLAKTPN